MIESHLNTFEKGMTKDVNVLYQPDGTYRNCINCSLVSQDGNNYVIKDCLGNVRTFVINVRYAGTFTTFDINPIPMGFISFPDKLIVFSTNSVSETGGYGEIGRIDYQSYGEGVTPVVVAGQNNAGYTPLYHSANLNFTTLRQIEGFALQENDLIQRVYWTDNLNEIRVLDIGNPIYTTYIGPTALVTGQKYMVLEGVISHGGSQYGPTSVASTIVDNVFTATGPNYTSITGTSPTPKVIAYVAYQLLSFTPSRSLGNIRFLTYGTGSLYCGAKMYFYRLVNSSQGVITSWSYGTYPISVRQGGINAYFTDLGGGTPTLLVNSAKSVQLTVDNIDLNFTRIQLACAEYDQLLDVPRSISIVLDVAITGSTMTLEHSTEVNLGKLTLSDITLFPASILTAKTLTTNKSYILAGNVQERGEITFDKSTVTTTQINYPLLAHQDTAWSSTAAGTTTAAACANVMTYVPYSYNLFGNPSGTGAIQPYTKWVVTNVSGGNVTYNAVSYGLGQVFIGVFGVYTVTIPGGSQIRACVSTNSYTTNATFSNAARPNITNLVSGYWDYKDPVVSNRIKGYWNAEKYRFGIVFFDLKGNPFYARHLADVNVSYNNASPFLGGGGPSFSLNDATIANLYMNQSGISFSGITIPAAFISQISGFSIMRAERDPRVMTQGLLIQSSISLNTSIAGFTIIQPACCDKLSQDSNSGSIAGFYSYICPDSLVSFPIPNFVDGKQSGPSLEEAYFVFPRDQSQGANLRYLKGVGSGTTGTTNEFETKYFDSNSGDSSSPRKVPIASQYKCNEKANIAQFVNTGIYFQNRTATGASVIVDTQCSTNTINSTTTLPNITVGAGGLREVVELSGDTMLDYNSLTVTYASVPNSGEPKLMMNYVINNPNQYGGGSDSALAATNYISTGHFQPINNTVMLETIDGNGNYTFNNVEIWGGDCYRCLIDYGYALYDDGAVVPSTQAATTNSYSWGIKFPCECNSNYTLRNGTPSRKIAPDYMHSAQLANGIFYKIGGKSQLEGFQYNQGYSSDGHIFAYPSLPLNFSITNTFRYRIRFAGPKFPGEVINSFRTFLVNDYRDLDGQGGEINNLRTKDGRTIVWQNAMIGTVPILERSVIADQSGAETVLGTGGVVDRFDIISSYFGNQHQWGLTATEYGYAWFDMRKKAVVILDVSSGIQEISKVGGLNGYFNEAFLEVIGNTSPIANNVLNDPTFSKYSDRPISGVGITGVYDPKFKMTYLTFKFIQRNGTTLLNKDFTIGYYHAGKQFIGFFDWTPAIAWNHNGIVLSANNPKNKINYFGPGMSSTLFNTGDVVPFVNTEYICISPVTITGYPGTGGPTGTNPATGVLYWAKINGSNELWVHNQPALLGQAVAPDYLYNSVFSQVINNEFDFVVNPRTENPFSVLNMEQEGNGVNFTSINTIADGQTASELNIVLPRRLYRVIYDKICSSLPLGVFGRITSSHLYVKLTKTNWTTDPRVVSTSVRILRFVKSFYEQKR